MGQFKIWMPSVISYRIRNKFEAPVICTIPLSIYPIGTIKTISNIVSRLRMWTVSVPTSSLTVNWELTGYRDCTDGCKQKRHIMSLLMGTNSRQVTSSSDAVLIPPIRVAFPFLNTMKSPVLTFFPIASASRGGASDILVFLVRVWLLLIPTATGES